MMVPICEFAVVDLEAPVLPAYEVTLCNESNSIPHSQGAVQ